jgi:hypothetical protein
MATNRKLLIKLVSAEGIESARERKFNDMQGHGWHLNTWKAAVGRQTDCKMDCRFTNLVRHSRAGSERGLLFDGVSYTNGKSDTPPTRKLWIDQYQCGCLLEQSHQ